MKTLTQERLGGVHLGNGDAPDPKEQIVFDAADHYYEGGRIQWKKAFEAHPEWKKITGAETEDDMYRFYAYASNILKKRAKAKAKAVPSASRVATASTPPSPGLDERDQIILDAHREFSQPFGKGFRVLWHNAFAAHPEWRRQILKWHKSELGFYTYAKKFLHAMGLMGKPGSIQAAFASAPAASMPVVKVSRRPKKYKTRKDKGLPRTSVPAALAPPSPTASIQPALAGMLANARSGMIHHAITTTLHDITKTMFQATLDLQASLVALNQQVLASGVPHGPQ